MTHELHFDHLGVHFNQAPFFPEIFSSDFKRGNVAILTLPAGKDELLKWEDSIRKAKQLVEEGKLILWKLDLGLEKQDVALDEQTHFLSSQIAVDEFVKVVWPQFKSSTFGIALYQGDFALPLGGEDRQAFSNWINEKYPQSSSTEYLMQHFQAEKTMVYIRLLANRIPDELLILLFLDFSKLSTPTEQFHLFSKECFEYFLLAIKGSILPIEALAWENGRAKFGSIDFNKISFEKSQPCNEKIGVIFPQEEGIDLNLFESFDQIFLTLIKEKIPFRILPENWAINMWDELDCLIVLKKALSDHTKRVLAGFSAAGGEIILLDDTKSLKKELGLLYENFCK